ncbi:hypothetical protein V5O48_003434 [Marasmius crinis-equi]|uniref:F-box domain-containing protein n=1 Tax=Marasmius crinis-equi TaxID=585013 RepID=A0ABR3FTD4_9AGAR
MSISIHDIHHGAINFCDHCLNSSPRQLNPSIPVIFKILSSTNIGEYITPTKRRAHSLDKHLREVRRELTQHESTLARLYDAVRMVETERDRLSIAVEQTSRMTQAYIHTLPPEILLKIFLLRWEGEVSSDTASNDPAAHASLVLSHVCSKWREIAIEASRLWSCVDVSFPDGAVKENRLERKQRFVQVLVERSRELPLRLSLHFPHDYRTQIEVAVILGDLREVSERWEEASLVLSSNRHWELPRSLPMLHTLKIEQRPVDRNSMLVFLQPQAGVAMINNDISMPSLRNLIVKMEGDVTALTQSLELGPLEHLAIRGSVSLPSITSALRKCKSLRSLEYTLPPTPSEINSVVIPTLKTLKLSCPTSQSTTALDPFLSRLTTPEVRSLSICGGQRVEGWIGGVISIVETVENHSLQVPTSHALVDFLTRSDSPLISLEIQPILFMDTESLGRILLMTPFLRSLVIHGAPSVMSDAIRRMTAQHSGDAKVLVPRLEVFELGCKVDPGRRPMEVAGIVESRWRFGEDEGPLKRLKQFKLVCFEQQLLEVERRMLRRMESEGLEVRIAV